MQIKVVFTCCIFFVTPKITRITLTKYLLITHFDQLQHIELPDPDFNKLGQIHILLPYEIFFELLCPTKINTHNQIFQENFWLHCQWFYMHVPQKYC